MSPTDPGWYPDPSDPSLQRYFNGTEWTDLPTPPPVGTVTQTSPPSNKGGPTFEDDPRTVLCWTVVAAGALVAIGSLLAWMTASAGIISISRNAFQMGDHESMTADGPIVMVLGLILIGIGIARLTNTSMPRFISEPHWFSATTTIRYANGQSPLTVQALLAQLVRVSGCVVSATRWQLLPE
jgi:hypothetical protein